MRVINSLRLAREGPVVQGVIDYLFGSQFLINTAARNRIVRPEDQVGDVRRARLTPQDIEQMVDIVVINVVTLLDLPDDLNHLVSFHGHRLLTARATNVPVGMVIKGYSPGVADSITTRLDWSGAG